MRIPTKTRRAILTYCTNVHETDDVAGLVRALDETTASVARAVAPGAEFGLGLRLGAEQVAELERDPAMLARLEDVFARHRFFPFTINAFPQTRFHARRVKGSVYRPDWTDPERARYTLAVARFLASWLPESDLFGTISTLPIGWKSAVEGREREAARQLKDVAVQLARLEQQTDARIMLCLEPEPGCALETIAEVVAFFQRHLFGGGSEAAVRRHLGVCYDACHQAVVFEDHDAALAALAAAGIAVGKVQISNALEIDCGRTGALDALLRCDEERFLHQVALRAPGETDLRRFDDLPDLEAATKLGLSPSGRARCHFHVPIHAESYPPLGTTRADLLRALEAILRHSDVRHFEVETYTFHVLPELLRGASIEEHLAQELSFARDALLRTG